MKDPEVEAYVEAIESHLRARRGSEHILSPRDFALARSWHASGVPLAVVLVAIDGAVEAGHPPASLAQCRRRVKELAASGKSWARPAAPLESVPLREVEEVLAALDDGLARLSPGPRACFEPPLRKVREVRDLLAVASRPNWDYLRGKLREIDDDVSAAVLQALPPEDSRSVESEATRAVERLRGRFDEAALADVASRYAIQRARERLRLPCVSLIE